MNNSEQLLSIFAEGYFFKELVQDDLCFVPFEGTEVELADLLINLGDIIIAIQLKSRNEDEQTTNQAKEKKWLADKCRKAKKQVKATMRYIVSGNLPDFCNKQNQKIMVRANAKVIPLVVFYNTAITEYPHVLRKNSKDGTVVNCMSFADFQEMCKVLITPMEIISYLEYRNDFYERNGEPDLLITFTKDNSLILTKPLHKENLVYQFLDNVYGAENAKRKSTCLAFFKDFLHALPAHTVEQSEENASYSILAFLAHMNRIEIDAFLARVMLTNNAAKKKKYGIIGSLRNSYQEYVIFFVASKANERYPMDYLVSLAREKQDVKQVLQVSVWWENKKTFRIDYILWDS